MKQACWEHGDLTDPGVGNALFGAWLDGRSPGVIGAATDELESGLTADAPPGPAPVWNLEQAKAQQPASWQQSEGRPAVVVTGQQPGLLGGPLLTLYKVATAIALAERRSASGRPTIAVFWSGDDDDDVAEAAAPRDGAGAEAPGAAALRRSGRHGGRRPPVLAGVEAGIWAAGAAQLLAAAGSGPATAAVRQWLKGAVAQDTPWGPGQAGLVRSVFVGQDLVVLRGNDPALHRAGAEFYAGAVPRLAELSRLARGRGEELAAAGFHAQLRDRSLAHPLYALREGRREPTGGSVGPDTGDLRPGVLLRALLQDWLLQPVAAVVGPGEAAYLKQLDPLYEALGVRRSALVPRLCGWAVPDAGPGPAWLAEAAALSGGSGPDPSERAAELCARLEDPMRRELQAILSSDLGVGPARAADLAASRVRRLHKGLAALFEGEIARQARDRATALPPWLMPAGQRQERSLGMVGALGLWGDTIVTGALQAAAGHLSAGQSGRWRQWAIDVQEPDPASERMPPT